MGCIHGCASSTRTRNQARNAKCKSVKTENGTEMSENDELLQRKRGKMDTMWNSEQERCLTDSDFADAVIYTLRANFDLLTIDDLENFISAQSLCSVDESLRKKIIHKIIGEQFVNGFLAVKAT